MTTSITIRARAHGALVTIARKEEGDEGHIDTEVEPNCEQTFHIDDSLTILVKQGNAPIPVEEPVDNSRPFEGEAVPGAAENDALLNKPKAYGKSKTASDPDED